MHGFGRYRETYREVDGQWRIATLDLTRLRVDIEGVAALELKLVREYCEQRRREALA